MPSPRRLNPDRKKLDTGLVELGAGRLVGLGIIWVFPKITVPPNHPF